MADGDIFEQLKQSIIDQDEDQVLAAVNAALDDGVSAKAIIDQGLLPGLNVIGEQFECEDIFLPELMQAARAALNSMIDLLTREHHMPAIDAYLLCSVCGDLRISEIVDMPNWVVSFYFPRMVLE